MKKSIKKRFSLTLVTTIIVIILSISLPLIFLNATTMDKNQKKQISQLLEFSRETLPAALWQYNYDYTEDFIASLFLYEDVAFVSLNVNQDIIIKKVRPDYETFSSSMFTSSKGFVTSKTQIFYKNAIVGTIYIVFSRDRIKRQIIINLVMSFLIILVLTAGVLITNFKMSNWYIFIPLLNLEKSVMKISQGALDTKIKYDREDEIGQLAKSFETMMINLKRITASRDELNFEITQRKKTEKKYRNLYENAQIGMFQSTINDGKLVDTNLRMAQILGYASPDECISNYVTDKHYVHSYQRDEVANLLKENSAIDNYKIKVKLDDSTMKWLQFSGVISDDGKIFEGVAADITEQKKHEKIIKNSLGEKEILLKEIHHRVKNNMQIIQSLLNLQLNTLTDSEQKKALIDSGNRIKSMALIHETLYSSEDIAHLDMEVYFDNIIQHLFKIYRSSDIHIDIKVNTDSQDLNMDSCIASGLIINELISNALKYAFIDTGKGNLSISLIRIDDKQGSLIVKDDGCGLPEDFEIEGTASLGLRIVRILAEGQMKGDLIVTSQGGTMFEIKFPISIKSLNDSKMDNTKI